MKTKLSQLTISEFIDLECGDVSVLCEKHEVVDMPELVRTREGISREFQSIASPSSYKSMVIDKEKKSKLRVKAQLFGCLSMLVKLDAIDEVRSLMKKTGYDCGRFSDERVRFLVNQRLNEAEHELKRMGVDEPVRGDVTEDDIRKGYEDMVADLMIVNKMSIDINTVRASVFAAMVRKANEMAKAMNAKLKKHK